MGDLKGKGNPGVLQKLFREERTIAIAQAIHYTYCMRLLLRSPLILLVLNNAGVVLLALKQSYFATFGGHGAILSTGTFAGLVFLLLLTQTLGIFNTIRASNLSRIDRVIYLTAFVASLLTSVYLTVDIYILATFTIEARLNVLE